MKKFLNKILDFATDTVLSFNIWINFLYGLSFIYFSIMDKEFSILIVFHIILLYLNSRAYDKYTKKGSVKDSDKK